MVEKILSQEEIDALLSAMSTGEVDLKPEKGAPVDLKPHDLAAQSAVLRSEFHALEEIHHRFAIVMTDTLTPYVPTGIEAVFVSTERVRFGDILKGCTNPTSFHLFSMEPLSGVALLSIEPKLVFSLVDCAFGGPGTPIEKPRPFTPIQQRVVGKMVMSLLKGLQSCWESIYPVSIAPAGVETNPDFLRFVDPKDFVLHSLFSLKGSSFAGNVNITMSYLMLEPIKDHLSPRYLLQQKGVAGYHPEITRQIEGASVHLTVELGRTVLTIGDLLRLRPNDVITLDRGPDDTAAILVEGISKYEGTPGVVKGSRAVQITRLLMRNGGSSSSGNK